MMLSIKRAVSKSDGSVINYFYDKMEKSEVLYDLYEKSRPERFAVNYEDY